MPGRPSGSRRRSARRRRARVVQRLEERPRVALAEEAPGVGDAEARPHGRGASSPAKSSKSQPFAIVTTWPRGASARISSAIASETHDRVGRRGDEAGDASGGPASLARTASRCRSAVRVGDQRVAQVGDPARAGRALDRRADEMDRPRRRGRDHDVDPLLADDPDRRRDRGQVPAHVLVRHEQPPAERSCACRREPLEPGVPCSSSAGCRPTARRSGRGAPRPARASAGRRRGGSTSGRPARARAARRPSAGQVRGELERALHAAAARGREVQRDEEHLHDGRR